MAERDPWIKFYPDDWNGDIELGSCSLAAQGLLMRLIAVMRRSDPPGYLLCNGSEPRPADISRMLGVASNTYRAALRELLEHGALRRDEIGIYSKRLRDDQRKRNVAKEYGKRGGNPILVNPTLNPTLNPGVNPTLNTDKNKNKNNPKGVNRREYTPEFETFWEAYPKKREKVKAYRTFKARLKDGTPGDSLTLAAINYAQSVKGQEERFIKYAATFLGPDRHFDEWLTPQAAVNPCINTSMPMRGRSIGTLTDCGCPDCLAELERRIA